MRYKVKELFERARQENKPLLLDLTAPWCSACLVQDAIIKRMAPKYSNDIIILKIDVEEHPEIPEQYDILGLPTLILFTPDGKEVWRSAGRVTQEAEIREAVEKFLSRRSGAI
jgi:thioredoxin-like negative regulator of GroEL